MIKLEAPLPDASMRDVRIVHDQVGAYADWKIVNGILPYGDRKERYLLGKIKPHYQLPVPMAVANTMIFADQHCFTVAAAWGHEEPNISALLRS